jgi:hypothetical protein
MFSAYYNTSGTGSLVNNSQEIQKGWEIFLLVFGGKVNCIKIQIYGWNISVAQL